MKITRDFCFSIRGKRPLGESSNRSELGDRDRIVIITRRKRQVTTSLLPSSSFVILNVTAAVVESMRATHPPLLPNPSFSTLLHKRNQLHVTISPFFLAFSAKRNFLFSRFNIFWMRLISSFSIPPFVRLQELLAAFDPTFNIAILARLHAKEL